jgi:hypothetical protein
MGAMRLLIVRDRTRALFVLATPACWGSFAGVIQVMMTIAYAVACWCLLPGQQTPSLTAA